MSSYAFLAETTAFQTEGQESSSGVVRWFRRVLAARRSRVAERHLLDQLAAMDPRQLADLDIDPRLPRGGHPQLSDLNPAVLAASAICGVRRG